MARPNSSDAQSVNAQDLFERLAPVLSRAIGLLAGMAMLLLGLRAALRLELRWDTFMYHLPFAAIRGGLDIPYSINDQVQGYFDGFPALPHVLQGLLWRVSGSVNATGVINWIGFVLFLLFCHSGMRVSAARVALISLTAPLVVIHMAVSYVDLFANCFLAIGVSAAAAIYWQVERQDLRLWVWGLVGLVGAAWSKFQLVPLVGLLFFGFTMLCLACFKLRRPRLLAGIAVAALLAAAPYLENWITHGNPAWPVRVPFVGELWPYELNIEQTGQVDIPPPLTHLSQPALFWHSMFEINHPTHYDHRQRWIIDQGNAWLAFRMGGLWNVGVAFGLLSVLGLSILSGWRRGLTFIGCVALLFLVVSVLPQSHQLRYYLFLPLFWSACIALLQTRLEAGLEARPATNYRRIVLMLLVIHVGLFGYLTYLCRSYYVAERVGWGEAAEHWDAKVWWSRLEPNQHYCVVQSMPAGFLMTGPTGREFQITDRSRPDLCPPGARLILPVVSRPHVRPDPASPALGGGDAP